MSSYTLHLIIDPLPGETDSWIELGLGKHPDSLSHLFFQIKWNADELRQWIKENSTPLLKEELPIFAPKAPSIAESIALFYDKELDPPDDQFDAMYSYRCRHGFRFALRGANIPDIYIGRFSEHHQISYMKNGKSGMHFPIILNHHFFGK